MRKIHKLLRHSILAGALLALLVIPLLPDSGIRAEEAYNPDPNCQAHVLGTLYGDGKAGLYDNGADWNPYNTSWKLGSLSKPSADRFERCAKYMRDHNVGGNAAAIITRTGDNLLLEQFYPISSQEPFNFFEVPALVMQGSLMQQRAFISSLIEVEGRAFTAPSSDPDCCGHIDDNGRGGTDKMALYPEFYLHVAALLPLAHAAGLTSAYIGSTRNCTPYDIATLADRQGVALCVRNSDFMVLREFAVATCERIPGFLETNRDLYACGRPDAPYVYTPEPDLVPPSLSAALPAADSLLSGTVIISYEAADDRGIAEAALLVDSQLAVSSPMPAGNLSWNSQSVANGTVVLQVRATDIGGNQTLSEPVSVQVENEPVPDPPQITSFTADQQTISAGGSVTLSWNTQSADLCQLDGLMVAQEGSTVMSGLLADTSYSLVCSDILGRSVSATVTVTVQVPAAPVITSYTAKPKSVIRNRRATLTWTTEHADYCSIHGGPSNLSANGSWRTPRLKTNKTYRLTCYGANGQIAESSLIITIR